MDRHITPDSVLNKTDVGDDTQRRFRYQAAYAAILSLELLKEEPEFEEIFCEHHEDILVKMKDKTFRGIQVKTRKEGLELFKASDPKIINALKRFIRLEKEFPNSFSKFVLATNYGFWQKRKNGSNLPYILELVRDDKSSEVSSLKRPLSTYIRKLINTQEVSSEFVLTVLGKTELLDNLPKFEDIESSLVREIARIPEIGKQKYYDDLQGVALSLIGTMFRASSLSHDSAIRYYFALLTDPERERKNDIIERKRITKEKVQHVLQELQTPEALLRTWNPVPLSRLPKSMRKMELKMAAGRISVPNIDLAKDHKISAETLISQWIHKYDTKKATERYEHVRTIIRTECQEAYDLVKNSDEPFGEKMLSEVRRRIRDRYFRDRHTFFDCCYEHLLGFAGILTEDCTQWWSKRFDIPEVSS